jgi:hypothetical protein
LVNRVKNGEFGNSIGEFVPSPIDVRSDMNMRRLTIAALILLAATARAMAQGTTPQAPATPPPQTTAPASRPTPPTRDPSTPGYVTAKELADGSVAPIDVDGNFVIGPTHPPAPEMTPQEGVPQGTILKAARQWDAVQERPPR